MEFRFRNMLMLAAALGLCRAGAEANGASPAAPPKGGVWDLAAAMPEPRQEAGSAALGNTIYVIGGYGPDMPPSTSVQVYDAAANKWRQAAPIPDGLHHHPGVAAANGKIYVIGGFAGSFAKRVPVNTVWQYDPADDRWEKRAPMPTGRSGGSAAVVNNRLYVFGGEGNAENTSLGTFNQVEFYDTARDAWTELAPMPFSRHAFGAAVVGKKIYLPGGSIAQGGRGVPGTTPITDTFEPN